MADDKKTLKFQMMMSPSEAEELDNWMFGNRIRSRAEAIRRLCQIGMAYDRSMARRVVQADDPEYLTEEDRQILKSLRVPETPPRVRAAIANLEASASEYQARMLTDYFMSLFEITSIKTEKNIDDALAKARELKADFEHLDVRTPEGRDKVWAMIPEVRNKAAHGSS
jgi:hypothetical protein